MTTKLSLQMRALDNLAKVLSHRQPGKSNLDSPITETKCCVEPHHPGVVCFSELANTQIPTAADTTPLSTCTRDGLEL